MSAAACRNRRRRGSALLSAIMVLLVLVGLVAAVAPVVRVDVRTAGREGDELRALSLARAGVSLALAALQADEPDVDGPEDEWAALGDGGEAEYPLGAGRFRVQVLDASSRIDLNRADRETLLRPPGIEETAVAEILAWRGDEDGAGASAGQYASLPRPYALKAAPFDSVEELLLVQGVTPSLFYGPREAGAAPEQAPWRELLFIDTWGPNLDAEGEARSDLNAAVTWARSRAFDVKREGGVQFAPAAAPSSHL